MWWLTGNPETFVIANISCTLACTILCYISRSYSYITKIDDNNNNNKINSEKDEDTHNELNEVPAVGASETTRLIP